MVAKKIICTHRPRSSVAGDMDGCDDSHVSRDMTCDIVMTCDMAQEAATWGQVGAGSNHTTADVLCHIMSAVHLYIVIKY